MSKPTLSRKEIASMTGLCEKTVKAKESIWGLDKMRVDLGSSRVRYNTAQSVRALYALGLASVDSCEAAGVFVDQHVDQILVPEQYSEKLDNPKKCGGCYCLRSGDWIKVGMSSENPRRRADSQLIPNVTIEWVYPCDKADAVEALFHKFLAARFPERFKSEWFFVGNKSALELLQEFTGKPV